jgi:hypothetical protein
MHRSLLLALIFTAGVLFAGARAVRAQEDEPRWEVGGQYSVIDFNNGSPLVGSSGTGLESESYPTESGFGGRVGYNVNSHLAVEAEVNFFPRDEFLEGGRKVQGLFGVRAGKRFERVGVYAKARPGFMRFGRGDFHVRPGFICIDPFTDCFVSEPTTNFAFDAGGVVELYPSKKTFVRFDAGDTMVRFGQRAAPVRVSTGSFGVFILNVEPETTHNFQAGVGFGFRF